MRGTTSGIARLLIAAAVCISTMLATAMPAAAGSFTPPMTLASPDVYWLWVNQVSSEGNNVVVSWMENGSELWYRLSQDNGKTFAPAVDAGTADSAGVTVCGGLVAAIRVVPSSLQVWLDLRDASGALVTSRAIASGRDLNETGVMANCIGQRRVATYWEEKIAGQWHLKVAVVPSTEPLPAYEFDLGRAHGYRSYQITSTGDALWMAWSGQRQLMTQRFDVANDATMTVTRGPKTWIARFDDAPGIGIAVSDASVYVTYARHGDAYIKISRDGGRNFGRAKVVYHDPSGGVVDVGGVFARNNVVVVNVHLGCWGCVGSNMARYSANWGRTWAVGPSNAGGYMSLGLAGTGPAIRILEGWDNRTLHDQQGARAYIKFRMGTP